MSRRKPNKQHNNTYMTTITCSAPFYQQELFTIVCYTMNKIILKIFLEYFFNNYHRSPGVLNASWDHKPLAVRLIVSIHFPTVNILSSNASYSTKWQLYKTILKPTSTKREYQLKSFTHAWLKSIGPSHNRLLYYTHRPDVVPQCISLIQYWTIGLENTISKRIKQTIVSVLICNIWLNSK